MYQVQNKSDLLKQLVEFYYRHDACQTEYLPYEAIWKLYSTLYERNRLCLAFDGKKLVGYCESARINYDVFGKIICGINLYQHLEDWDIENGPIAYCANVTILPELRGTSVIKDLTRQFFTKNQGAEFYVGRAFRKRHQPIKVFNFHDSYNKWVKEEV